MQDIHEAKARLKGIFNITVTPFEKDGAINFSALAENIERVIALGYDGILIGGTYGEFATMDASERAALFRQSIDVAANRVPVLLCSAGSDPRLVRELTKLASDLGGIPMMTPPFVSEVTDNHIIEAFRAIAPLSKTGFVIYNAPGIGIVLSPSTIERLAEIPGVIGLKQGELAPATVDALSNRLRGRIRLFCASDLAFLGPIAAGFDGLSSTNSGALPELILQSFKAISRGDAKTAGDLHRIWYPFREVLRRLGQPQTTKAAMNLRGFKGGFVRAPLSDLKSNERQEVAKALDSIAANPASALGAIAA